MQPAVQPDDKALVEAARRGSEPAFRALVERYQRRLYGMALGMVRDPDEARDVVQDTLLKAFRHLDTYQGEAAFYTWIYRIAMNLCIDRARRNKRSSKVEFDETIDRADHEEGDSGIAPHRLGFDPHQALRDREIRERVGAALLRLSPTHRAIIQLREVDGLSYKEIAEVMECSEGTVMSRLFHARKKMQEMLRSFVEGNEGLPAPAPAEVDTDDDVRATGTPTAAVNRRSAP